MWTRPPAPHPGRIGSPHSHTDCGLRTSGVSPCPDTRAQVPHEELEYRVRIHMRAWVVCGLAVGLAAAGCTRNSGNRDNPTGPSTEHQAIVIDTEGKAPVPAAPVPNAKPGGTIFWLADGAPEH